MAFLLYLITSPALCSIKELASRPLQDGFFEILVCYLLSLTAFQVNSYSRPQHLASDLLACCETSRVNLDLGTIPHALQSKNQNIKSKQYCNRFNKVSENGPYQKDLKPKPKRNSVVVWNIYKGVSAPPAHTPWSHTGELGSVHLAHPLHTPGGGALPPVPWVSGSRRDTT